YVGVIDEGIDLNHPDLAANIWTNLADPVGDSNGDRNDDDDGNGYVDDAHGWDFVHNDNSIYDDAGDDHGTHVAGTIGAVGGNGGGVAGVSWNVTIISAKFLGPNGGAIDDAVKAVDYITDLKTRHKLNIVATNNSWGWSSWGSGSSLALEAAIERANAAGILFIAAAGNGGGDGKADNTDNFPFYPASYTNSNIISVTAFDSAGNMPSWANFGKKSVDLGAPGVGVYSTLPRDQDGSYTRSYGSYSGTSMATPHVTGGAALYASTHQGVTASDIKNAILTSTVPTRSLNSKTVTAGRLNVSGY
ncbi:MAG TPA: S8 family serine peptidase, partial [Herpetosiphonaceae bacterium]|nr:S8 family serine peptidase [Herpetosiphonaceae bacterium]